LYIIKPTNMKRIVPNSTILVTALMLILGSGSFLNGSTLTVTNTNDSGDGSLRGQITLANANDTIVFNPALNGSTIILTNGNIAISQTLTIIGPGYNFLTISGNNNSRIFDITGGNVSIKGLKLINGNQTSAGTNDGGAIRHQAAGNLTLNNVYFENNMAVNGNGSQGGAVYYGVNGGHFKADSCFFINSQSDNYGGAVTFNSAPASATLNYCWFNGNKATGGACGTLFSNAEILTVTNSTFSNSSADQRSTIWLSSTGSGNEAYSFINCTFSNNTVTGQPYQEFGVTSGILKFVNCTYANNSEPISIADDFMTGTTELIVQNSIFSNNSGGNYTSNFAPKLTSLGGNISSDTTMKSFLTSINDKNETDPLIGPLGNNGGFMHTCALLVGSPAIDNGINSGAPFLDQIGNTRGAVYDAGSVEFNSANGINENAFTRDCKIFPNPTHGKFSLIFDAVKEELNVSLYTLNGQLIEKRKVRNVTNLSFEIDEPAGIYLLKISDNRSQPTIIKIVKK
jgi:hypothetical protein